MRTKVFRTVVAILLLATGIDASEEKTTDARRDELFGPVRFVSTKQESQQLDWGQKDAKIAIGGSLCAKCEYDIHGNRVGAGRRIVYNESGEISEKIYENADGEITARDVMGPFGITEQISYVNGKPIRRSVKRYDANGNMAESYTYDDAGNVTASTFCTSDIGGHNRDARDYGEKGIFQAHYTETYDPKSDVWTFTDFDEVGAVKAAIVTKNSDVVSYWQKATAGPVFGSNFFMDPDGRIQKSYSCNPDGTCDHITSYFDDDDRHHVRRVEWRDPEHNLRLSFDYEYQLDRFNNWTKRTVWVWSPELGERKLAEVDFQTLTYWNK